MKEVKNTLLLITHLPILHFLMNPIGELGIGVEG